MLNVAFVGHAPAGYPQEYADLTFHFVERPPEWLICAVCQELAQDPMQANCCGKIYCTRCIESWMTNSKSCPTCRSTKYSDRPFNVFQDRNAHQRITSLAIYCPNQCDGCSKTVELSELENHLSSDNGCLFQVMECGNKCGHWARRSSITEHMTTECKLRSESCPLEQEVSSQEQKVDLQDQEVSLQDQEVSLQEQEVSLQDQEENCQDVRPQEMDELAGKMDTIAL